MKIMTRARAVERGLPRYFTGEPCVHGHIAPRRTVNYGCTACVKEAQIAAKARYFKNRDAAKNGKT